MHEAPDRIVQGLQDRLGPGRVLADPDTLAGRARDTWPLRLVQAVAGAADPPPRCVVKPHSTGEVAAALRYLGQAGVTVVPYGGGSGVGGGARPDPGSAVVDVAELNRIIELDEANLTVTAGAGVVLEHLEKWLNERGYITGHYPQSIALAQLGGLVATRSAGQFSTRYGNIEDLVTGLEAVLPNGQVVRVRSVPRRAAGPDLRHLWLGSEGSFGIITEVTLKVFPHPAERWLHAYALGSMHQGLGAVQGFMRAGWRPAVVRLHDEIEAERSFAGTVAAGESILLLLSEGPAGYAAAEGAAVDRTVQEAGGRPLGPGPVEAWLARRNDVHEFEQYIRMGIIVDTIEVAAGWSAIGDIYTAVTGLLRREVPELAVVSGHSSHSYPQGTNLYFTLGAVPPRDPAAMERVYWSIWSRVMETTLQRGGTICHHHGIGKLRAPWLPAELGSSYVLLERLKAALDPAGLMNPGTLLPRPGQAPPRP